MSEATKSGVLAGNSVNEEPGYIYGEAVPLSGVVLEEDRVEEEKDWQIYNGGISGENEYVMFFNKSSNYLKNITELLNASPTVKSICKNKVNLTLGSGFIPAKGRVKTILAFWKKLVRKFTGDKELERLEEVLCDVNLKHESLRTVGEMGAMDFHGLGNCAFEMVRVRGSEERKAFYIYHIPLQWVRIKKEADRIPKEVGILEDWDKYNGVEDEEVKKVALYPNWTRGAQGEERSVIFMKDYAVGLYYYGLADWVSAKLAAELEYKCPKFNNAKLDNGYMPSAICQFFGSMTKEDAKAMVNDLKDKFTGIGKNGKIFFQVLRDEKLKAHVQLIEDKNDGSFLDLMRVVSQQLVTACRWSMALAGIATGGKLGTNQQMRTEFEIVYNMVIEPVQNRFLTEVFNVFMKERAEWMGELKDINLTISNSIPVSFQGDLNVAQYITRNEGREILGYESLEDDRGGFMPDFQSGNKVDAGQTEIIEEEVEQQ